jgi:hypothetical protein
MPPMANAASEATPFDNNLPLTPNGIPISLRLCFQTMILLPSPHPRASQQEANP